jgi:hypothetical protein
MTLKKGDRVVFAVGVTASMISADVGGGIESWNRALTGDGDLIEFVYPTGKVTLQTSGMWCWAEYVQLLDAKEEEVPEWAARWSKMMEG